MRKAWLTGLAALTVLAACEQELILTGERLDLRADLDAETAAAPPEDADETRPIALPPAQNAAEWTHRAFALDNDIGHRAFATAPQLIWAADVGQGNDRKHRITAEPVVADGRIFTVDSRSTVSAHSLGGQLLWQVDLTPGGESPDDASGAGLAVSGGRLYVTSGFGFLAALDAATGQEYWRHGFDAAVAGAPAVSGGTVYAVTRDARAWALDTATGRAEWHLNGTPSTAGVLGGTVPALTGDTVVLPFASTELVAATTGGDPKWAAVVAGQRPGRVYARITDVTGDPVISGSTVYAGNPSGRMVALDLGTGEQRWFAEEGALSAVTVAGGSVFAVSDRNELVRLDAATGARIWGTELPFYVRQDRAPKRKEIYAHYGPVLAGGLLWVASSDDQLRAFNPVDGALARSVPLPGGAATPPIVVGGVMYVVSAKGQLLAFR